MENKNTYELDPNFDSVCTWPDGTVVDANGIAEILNEHLDANDKCDLAKVTTAAMCAFDHLAGPKNIGGLEENDIPDPKTEWKFEFVDKSDWPKEEIAMPNEENEEFTVVEETQTQPEVKTTSEPNYKGIFLAGFIGGAATALGKVAVDLLAPKVKEASEKLAEKAKARRAERKKLKEQKKLEALIEAEKAKTE